MVPRMAGGCIFNHVWWEKKSLSLVLFNVRNWPGAGGSCLLILANWEFDIRKITV
jgi:hypothetical protein